MIKELWILVKMLFAKRQPKGIERVSLMGMNHFPFSGYKYLMWCGKMIYRNDMYDRLQKEWPTDSFKVSENHEQIHLMQAKQCGSWLKYYWRYFLDWLKGNPIIAPASSAYYTTMYESEAYANEEDMTYPKNYDASNLDKYKFKNRKKLYREASRASGWKTFVKSI